MRSLEYCAVYMCGFVILAYVWPCVYVAPCPCPCGVAQFIIQSTSPPVNESLMELLLMIRCDCFPWCMSHASRVAPTVGQHMSVALYCAWCRQLCSPRRRQVHYRCNSVLRLQA
jgi:hypothetical protein